MNTAIIGEFEDHHLMPAKSIAVGTIVAMPNSYKIPESGLKNLSFDEWIILLKEFPQFAPRYNWRMLRPENWQKMPFVPQQFSASLDWVRTNGANWAKILNENPELFREKCDWSNLQGLNWAWLLRWKPEFADLCDWRKLQDSHWGWLLERRPEFEWIKFDVEQSFKHNQELPVNCNPERPVDCNWAELTGGQWAQLLARSPEFSDKCNWEKLSQGDFCYLLQRQPKFIDKLNFPVLYGTQWIEVIRAVPAICDIIASKLDWSCVSWQDLLAFLLGHKEYIDKIDLEKFNGIQWSQLLTLAPEFAYKCKWQELSQTDWCYLLHRQPSFINKLDFPVLYGGRWLEFVDTSKEIGDIVVDKIDWSSVNGQELVRFLQSHSEYAAKCDLGTLNCNDIVNLLSCQPQLAGKCDLSKLDCNGIVNLLSCQPQLAVKCDWENLDADSLCALLSKRPELADNCDWSKLTGDAWVGLLLKLPQFANKCDWSKLKGADWFHLLSEGSQFASKCDWDKLEDAANLSPFGDGWESVDDGINEENHSWWDVLLFSHPEYAIYRKWDKVYGEDCKRFPELFDPESRLIIDYSFFVKYFCDSQYSFCEWKRPIRQDWYDSLDAADMVTLLARQPRLADKCNLSKLRSRDWVSLILRQPQLANDCDWSKFKGDDWALLLAEQPQLVDKCETSILTGKNWATILSRQPRLADSCEWQKLNGADWVALLGQQPCFSDKCSWELLNGHDWASLLASQPQFANLCDWEKLYLVCPDVVNDFVPVSYEDQQVFCWAKLIQAQPQFDGRCDWSRLTGKDWALLLRDCPQYADKCDWSKLYENSVVKVECDPAYCEDCSLSPECKRGYNEQPFNNWAVLLDKQPQFADKCEWRKLNESDQANQTIAKLKGIELPKGPNDCYRDYMMQRKSQKMHLDLALDIKLLTEYDTWAYEYNRTSYNKASAKLSGYGMMLWLRYNYKSAKSQDWDKLNGSDWVGLLRWKPNLATHCDWSKLTGRDWAILLSFYHEFIECCECDKTKEWTGRDWAMVIRNEPKLATKERLDKMKGEDLVVVLIKQPHLADKCDLSKLSGWNWASLLQAQPNLEEICDWSKFSANHWVQLLKHHPQFAKHRDWKSISGKELVQVLIELPDFERYCDLEKLYESTGSGEDEHILFMELLCNARCDANDKNVWNRFSNQDKKWLMQHFLDYKYSHVTSVTRRIPVNCRLTRIENEESEEKIFKKDLDWGDLSGNDIVQLLGTFPQLSDRCDLTRLTVGNWVDLLERQPAFAAQCGLLQEEIKAERQRRKDEYEWEVEKYRQERDAEDAGRSHKFDLECDDPEYADMEYWNTH